MGMTTSPDTLLRRVKRLENEPAAPPRVVGIDDRRFPRPGNKSSFSGSEATIPRGIGHPSS
jgi:hypothetical protein